jgi:vacuolar-type H+-ATPase subunit I/STV1
MSGTPRTDKIREWGIDGMLPNDSTQKLLEYSEELEREFAATLERAEKAEELLNAEHRERILSDEIRKQLREDRKNSEAYQIELEGKYLTQQRRIAELEAAFKEECIEADTMRQHHKNAEAVIAELRKDRERLDWFLKDEGLERHHIDASMRKEQN